MGALKGAVRKLLVLLGVYPHAVLWLLPFKKIEFAKIMAKARLTRQDVVLDLGCGGGFVTVLVARRVARAVGVDVSTRSIEVARRDAAIDRNVEFYATSLQDAAFGPGSFDKVLSFSVLEHIPEYVEVLREIHRILKPRGQLVFSCDALQTIDDSALIEQHRRDHFVHQYFTAAELTKVLACQGFIDIDVEPIFSSDYARMKFSQGIRNRFAFGIIRSVVAYFAIRFHERREVRGASKGIFLLVSCRKEPALSPVACA